jgi:hypothetical protein
LVVRTWETDGRTTVASLDAEGMDVTSAKMTDLLERDLGKAGVTGGVVSVPIRARGISTVRLLTGKREGDRPY